MVSTNNYIKLDKETLANWVKKTLDQSFIDKNILSRFKITRIWPLNLTTMHEKTSPNNLYTTDNTIANNRQGEDGDYTSNEENEMDEEDNNKIQWEKQFAIAKLINMSNNSIGT